VIFGGNASGPALVSPAPLSFFGGFDLTTGVVTEREHPLEGQSVAGCILVFPTGTGSTVGSFALLRMVKSGVGPLGLVLASCDTIVAVGAIVAEIPCVDQIDLGALLEGLEDGTRLSIDGCGVTVA
jgi:predicted aconitase with swiveling domain